MAIENIEKFEEILKSDKSMIDEINRAADAYTGDKNDENAVFDAVLAPILKEKVIPFTFDELVEYKNKLGELSEDELSNVAGGWAYCIVIGFSNDISAEINKDEVHACAYIGIGEIRPNKKLKDSVQY